MSLSIKFVTPTASYVLDLEPSTTLPELRVVLEQHTHVPADEQRLILRGQTLHDYDDDNAERPVTLGSLNLTQMGGKIYLSSALAQRNSREGFTAAPPLSCPLFAKTGPGLRRRSATKNSEKEDVTLMISIGKLKMKDMDPAMAPPLLQFLVLWRCVPCTWSNEPDVVLYTDQTQWTPATRPTETSAMVSFKEAFCMPAFALGHVVHTLVIELYVRREGDTTSPILIGRQRWTPQSQKVLPRETGGIERLCLHLHFHSYREPKIPRSHLDLDLTVCKGKHSFEVREHGSRGHRRKVTMPVPWSSQEYTAMLQEIDRGPEKEREWRENKRKGYDAMTTENYVEAIFCLSKCLETEGTPNMFHARAYARVMLIVTKASLIEGESEEEALTKAREDAETAVRMQGHAEMRPSFQETLGDVAFLQGHWEAAAAAYRHAMAYLVQSEDENGLVAEIAPSCAHGPHSGSHRSELEKVRRKVYKLQGKVNACLPLDSFDPETEERRSRWLRHHTSEKRAKPYERKQLKRERGK